MTDVLSALAGVAAAVIAVVAAYIAHQQAQVAVRAQDVSVLLPLYQTHESSEFDAVRQRIRQAAPGEQIEPEPQEEQRFRDYINYLTFVCKMADEKLVTERYAAAIFDGAIEKCLDHCRAYIDRLQAGNGQFAAGLRRLSA